MKIFVVGLGLIGGSMALELKQKMHAVVYGVDSDPDHIEKAFELGIIDKKGSIDQVGIADIVILAVPVDALKYILPEILDHISNDALVLDVGSTKLGIAKVVENHPRRGNFVAAHPIAGTEFSGPTAAHVGLFNEKVNIICDKDLSSDGSLTKAMNVFGYLGMRNIFMNSKDHDKHIAYVSHISHISSFMLGKTVLEIEQNEKNIFDMAGSGFESTVRLAKSSPEMWSPIFLQNKENVLPALNEYIKNLQEFKALIEANDREGLRNSMEETNHIKTILKNL